MYACLGFAWPSELFHASDTYEERAQSWTAEQGTCLRRGTHLVQQDAGIVPLVFTEEVGVAVLCELPIGGLDGLRRGVVIDLRAQCTAPMRQRRILQGTRCALSTDRSSAAGKAGLPPEARSSL